MKGKDEPGVAVEPEQVRELFPTPSWSSGGLGWTAAVVDFFEILQPRTLRTPPVDHHLVLVQTGGHIRFLQSRGGRSEEAEQGPGSTMISVTGQAALWRWDRPVDALHVWLPHRLVQRAAAETGMVNPSRAELQNSFAVPGPVLRTMAGAMFEELKQGVRPGGSLLVECIATAMAIQLLRDHGAHTARLDSAAMGRLDDRRVRRVVDYMRENLGQRVELDDLAEVAGVSRFHLARLFKAATGESPHRFLLRLRVERAASLLSSDELPIAGVAAVCGFADQAHMTRQFRAAKGTTPGAFRVALLARSKPK